MQKMKKLMWTLIAGGLIGAVLFAWLSPYIIVWYFSPPADLGISCKSAVEWAIETYRKVMFTGVLLGVIVSSILFFAFVKRGSSAQAVPEIK
jgi:formate/nitrite transporter FocA (FNT family)